MWWELVCYEFSRDLQNKEEFLEYRFRFSSGFYREREVIIERRLDMEDFSKDDYSKYDISVLKEKLFCHNELLTLYAKFPGEYAEETEISKLSIAAIEKEIASRDKAAVMIDRDEHGYPTFANVELDPKARELIDFFRTTKQGREACLPLAVIIGEMRQIVDDLLARGILTIIPQRWKHSPMDEIGLAGVRYPHTFEEMMGYRYCGRDCSFEEYMNNPVPWDETVRKMKEEEGKTIGKVK